MPLEPLFTLGSRKRAASELLDDFVEFLFNCRHVLFGNVHVLVASRDQLRLLIHLDHGFIGNATAALEIPDQIHQHSQSKNERDAGNDCPKKIGLTTAVEVCKKCKRVEFTHGCVL